MTSRLKTSNKKNNSELPFSNATRASFDSRPFVVQSKSDNSKQSDLQTSLMQADSYGHHLSETNLANESATAAVQPKLDNQPIQTAPKKPGKQKQLEELGKKAPGRTPAEILKQNPHLLVGKKDPHKSGDHSPSLVSYNKTTDSPIRATGRAHAQRQQGQVNLNIGQNQIPTHHFTGQGAQSHSALTSLRAAGGVGEHASHAFDDLLDKTGSAYRGTPKLQNGAPIRSHVRLPGTASNSQNNLTSKPVAPLIGQQIINMDMRNSVKKKKPEHNSLGSKLLHRKRK